MPKKKTPKPKQPRLVKHEFEIVVTGLRYRVTQSTRRMLHEKVKSGPIFCKLVREPENMHDENAIKVVIQEGNFKGMHIGYIQRGVAAALAVLMDAGEMSDVLLGITEIDVDDGTADATLQFMGPVGKRKTA